MNIKNSEKICSYSLIITSLFLIIDTFLANQFQIGNEDADFRLAYCIGFVLSSSKFPNIMKNKFVVYPLYIMIGQMVYSLIINRF